jgi:hypothetical protein
LCRYFQAPIAGAPFDAVFSVLVILHIPERARLWAALAAVGGPAHVDSP